MSASPLELEKVILYPEHPMKLSGEEDRVIKSKTSGVMEHSLTLQGATSHAHGMKSCLGDREVLLRSAVQYPLISTINASFIIFLCFPRFMNLGMRFLLRGEGCNIMCFENTNQSH
jgi:hypothetical protein